MASEERAVLDMLDSMRDSTSTSNLAISPSDEVIRYELHDSPQINQSSTLNRNQLSTSTSSPDDGIVRYELHDSPQISGRGGAPPSSFTPPQFSTSRKDSYSSASSSYLSPKDITTNPRRSYQRTKSTPSASNVGIAPNSPDSRSYREGSEVGSEGDDGRRGSVISLGSTGTRFRGSNLSSVEAGDGTTSSRGLAPAFSPTKRSVKSFASAFEQQNQQQSKELSGSISGSSSLHSSGGSGSGSKLVIQSPPIEESSVRKAIREREEALSSASSKIQELRRGSNFSSTTSSSTSPGKGKVSSSSSSFISAASPSGIRSRQGSQAIISPTRIQTQTTTTTTSSPQSNENIASPIQGSTVSSSNVRGTDVSRSTSGTMASTSLWSRVISRRPESPDNENRSTMNPFNREGDSRYGLPSSSDGNNLPEGFRFNREEGGASGSSSEPFKPRLRRDWTIATSMAPSLGPDPSKIATIQETQSASSAKSTKTSKSEDEEIGSENSASNRFSGSFVGVETAEIRSARNVSVLSPSGLKAREIKPLESSPIISNSPLNTGSIRSTSTTSSSPLPPRAVLASIGASQDNSNITPSPIPDSSILRSPGKAKDLIKYFEQGNSAPASPSTPRTLNTPTKTVTPSSGLAQRLRRAMGVSESDAANVGLSSTQISSPELLSYRRTASGNEVSEKIAAQSSRIRPRVASRLAAGVTVGDDVFGVSNELDQDDENSLPPSFGEERESSPSRRRPMSKISSSSIFNSSFSFGGASGGNQTITAQDSQSPSGRNRGESAPPPPASGSNLYQSSGGASTSRSDPPPGQTSSASLSKPPSNDSPPKKSPVRSNAFSSGVKSFVSAFTKGVDFSNPSPPKNEKKETENPAPIDDTTFRPTVSRSSTALSSKTVGTTASFRRHSEIGDLPLDSQGALSMLEGPVGLPFRVGTLFYFNVHSKEPYWQRVQATLLPSALALSWIPPGGGRENVLLDLKSCREVHSVPSPDHPSSLEDLGAVKARAQGLGNTSPFQLIFEDGVERMAAENARERVQWVSAVW